MSVQTYSVCNNNFARICAFLPFLCVLHDAEQLLRLLACARRGITLLFLSGRSLMPDLSLDFSELAQRHQRTQNSLQMLGVFFLWNPEVVYRHLLVCAACLSVCPDDNETGLRNWPKKEPPVYTAVGEKHSLPLGSASRLLGGAQRRFMWSNKSKPIHDLWGFFFSSYSPTVLICPLPCHSYTAAFQTTS